MGLDSLSSNQIVSNALKGALRYIPNPDDLASMVGWLSSIYAVCQFIAASYGLMTSLVFVPSPYLLVAGIAFWAAGLVLVAIPHLKGPAWSRAGWNPRSKLSTVARRSAIVQQLWAHHYSDAEFVRTLVDKRAGVRMYLLYGIDEIEQGAVLWQKLTPC